MEIAQTQIIMDKDRQRPIRLPRKLKKDIIKTSGRSNYYAIIAILRMKYEMTGNQYTNIKKAKK